MPLRACASLGCSYAKFDERGFSGSDELGLHCEIRFLVKTLRGLQVALFLYHHIVQLWIEVGNSVMNDNGSLQSSFMDVLMIQVMTDNKILQKKYIGLICSSNIKEGRGIGAVHF